MNLQHPEYQPNEPELTYAEEMAKQWHESALADPLGPAAAQLHDIEVVHRRGRREELLPLDPDRGKNLFDAVLELAESTGAVKTRGPRGA